MSILTGVKTIHHQTTSSPPLRNRDGMALHHAPTKQMSRILAALRWTVKSACHRFKHDLNKSGRTSTRLLIFCHDMFMWTRIWLVVGGLLCFGADAGGSSGLLEFLLGPRLGRSVKDSRYLDVSPAVSNKFGTLWSINPK